MDAELELRILKELRAMQAEIGDLHAEVKHARADICVLRDRMVTKSDLRCEINSPRADIASNLAMIRKDVGEQIVDLRRAVVEYRVHQ